MTLPTSIGRINRLIADEVLAKDRPKPGLKHLILNGTDRARTDDLLRVKQAQTAHIIGSHGFEPIPHLTITSHSAKIVRKIVRREHLCYERALPVCPPVVIPMPVPSTYSRRPFCRESRSDERSSLTELNWSDSAARHTIKGSVSPLDRSSCVVF